MHCYVQPIWWLAAAEGGDRRIRSGTTFFLDCGEGPFGVTAGHVYHEFAKHAVSPARIFDSPWAIDLRERLIARGERADIATFRVSGK